MVMASPHHVVFFPFMAKGHTIPLLHLIRILRRRFPHLSITVFATDAYRPFISHFLSDSSDSDPISIIDLCFPQNAPGLPPGVESTDTLPSLSLLPQLWFATKLMQPQFEKHLQSLPPVTFLISDMFLWWTLDSASKFGIPRIYFSGMSNFSTAVTSAVMKNRLLAGDRSSVDELITVPDFPWLKVSRGDWEPPFWEEADPTNLHYQLIRDSIDAAANSYGTIVNSFYELEPMFCDYIRSGKGREKAYWNIGPLCLDPTRQSQQLIIPDPNEPRWWWLEWLDEKLRHGESVLYVAFGSQAEISSEQVREMEIGLGESGVNFLWVRADQKADKEIMEEKGPIRGIVVREWVDQWKVLKHGSVKGFLSHCGWNSAVESLSCGVPILAFPLSADQSLNAKLVVEELRAGIRAVGSGGGRSMKEFVKGKDLERCVRELMEGERGKELRKKAMEISEMANKAMAENGSSFRSLEQLVEEMCSKLPLPPQTDHTLLANNGDNGRGVKI